MPDIRFDPKSHQYFLGEEELPSVTRILGEMGLTADLGWIDPVYRVKGQRIHEGCQLVDLGEWDAGSTHPILVPPIQAYQAFLGGSGFEVKLIEKPVWSASMRVAGTLDRWGMTTSGKRCLVELKSGSSRPDPATGFQTALYRFLLAESHGMGTDEELIVWLRDDGTPQVTTIPNGERNKNLQRALGAVDLWRWRTQHGRIRKQRTPENNTEV